MRSELAAMEKEVAKKKMEKKVAAMRLERE